MAADQLQASLEIASAFLKQTFEADSFPEWAAKTESSVLRWALNLTDGQPIPHAVTDTWPLASLESVFLVVTTYLTFVAVASLFQRTSLGYSWDLYGLRFVYNVFQVMLCSYMSVEAILLAYRNEYVLVCNAANTRHPPIAKLLWLFYISKVLDFMDTFFIIMSRKWTQLTLLHVYHHATIFTFYWLNLRVAYDGDVYLTIILNGFVHSVMYTYYFLSMQAKDIWWKKYLTQMQMIQFVLMCSQAVYLIATQCSASCPLRVTIVYFLYIVSLLVLFLQYYISQHIAPKSHKHQSTDSKPEVVKKLGSSKPKKHQSTESKPELVNKLESSNPSQPKVRGDKSGAKQSKKSELRGQ